MSIQDNSINYIEFPATDMEKTKQFYSAAFGWTFTDYGPTYASFSGAAVDGGFTLDRRYSWWNSILLCHACLQQSC